jgi:hypothetical protein
LFAGPDTPFDGSTLPHRILANCRTRSQNLFYGTRDQSSPNFGCSLPGVDIVWLAAGYANLTFGRAPDPPT